MPGPARSRPAPASRRRTAARDLRLLAGSAFLSSAGDLLAMLTLALAVHEITGSGIAVSAYFAATMVPTVAVAPLAGLVADRFEPVRVMAAASIAQAALAVALAATPGHFAAILALSALLAVGSAISQPAEFALVPHLSDEEGLTRANGVMEAARYAGFAAGPVLAGVVAVVGGPALALLLNAASFLAIAGAAALIRTRRGKPGPERARPERARPEGARPEGARPEGARPERARPERARPGVGPEPDGAAGRAREAVAPERNGGAEPVRPVPPDRARDGLSVLWADPVLRPALAAAVGALLFISASLTAEVFYIQDVVGAGATGYAATTLAWMLGMVVGATRIAPRVRTEAIASAALVGLVVQGAGMGGQTIWTVLPFAIAGYAIGGIGHGAKNTLLRTLIQRRVPDRLHGRAFAAYNAARNTAEVAALGAGGVLVAALGPRAALVLAGAGSMLAAAAGLTALRRAPRRKTTPPVITPHPVPEAR